MEIDVNQARERTGLIAEIKACYARSEQLIVQSFTCADAKEASSLYQEGLEVASLFEKLRDLYYARFPNCLSKEVSVWAK